LAKKSLKHSIRKASLSSMEEHITIERISNHLKEKTLLRCFG